MNEESKICPEKHGLYQKKDICILCVAVTTAGKYCVHQQIKEGIVLCLSDFVSHSSEEFANTEHRTGNSTEHKIKNC